MKRTRVGVIGAGNISGEYLSNLSRYPEVELVAVASRTPQRAAAQAATYGIATSGSNEVVLDDPSIAVVVNLTTPDVHVEVTSAALRAGKHVWSEKALAPDRESGRALLELAAGLGLRLGCAPDTVLCPGPQHSLATLAQAVAADGRPPFRARMLYQYHGPDAWHPNPEFLFKAGAGPLLDIGPYYLTFAVLALGPVRRVAGSIGVRPRTTREVGQGELAGTRFSVEVPTTVVALLEHESGAFTDITLSFDAQIRRTEVEFQTPSATVIATNPSGYGGTVRVMVRDVEVTSVTPDDAGWGRGVGCLELVRAIAAGEEHRTSGQLAYHVLDVMLSVEDSIEAGQPVEVGSTAPQIPLIPPGWHPERPPSEAGIG